MPPFYDLRRLFFRALRLYYRKYRILAVKMFKKPRRQLVRRYTLRNFAVVQKIKTVHKAANKAVARLLHAVVLAKAFSYCDALCARNVLIPKSVLLYTFNIFKRQPIHLVGILCFAAY